MVEEALGDREDLSGYWIDQAEIFRGSRRTPPRSRHLDREGPSESLFGHEFLDASREPSRWEKAKSVVLEKTGGLSLEALKQVLFQLIRDAVSGV
jgi:hypothetical protein